MADESSVSVVIPVYNGARYLGEAIESALRQSAPPFEVIVVDDGSTDTSAAVAGGFAPRVRYHLQPNSGAATARNTGLGLATGEFIAFLDADDRWHVDKLRLQRNAFTLRPELDMVFCKIDEFLSPDIERTASTPELRTGLAAYSPSGVLARRSSFDRVGPFATDCGIGEFIDWYARATDEGLIGLVLPEALCERRIHDANQGVTKRDSYNAEYLKILKRTLDRRRAKQQR